MKRFIGILKNFPERRAEIVSMMFCTAFLVLGFAGLAVYCGMTQSGFTRDLGVLFSVIISVSFGAIGVVETKKTAFDRLPIIL